MDNQIDYLLAGVFGGHPVEDPSTISPSGDVEAMQVGHSVVVGRQNFKSKLQVQ